ESIAIEELVLDPGSPKRIRGMKIRVETIIGEYQQGTYKVIYRASKGMAIEAKKTQSEGSKETIHRAYDDLKK
ncbi:hypothetical protein RUM43_009345, partial [Polyplax serrata]